MEGAGRVLVLVLSGRVLDGWENYKYRRQKLYIFVQFLLIKKVIRAGVVFRVQVLVLVLVLLVPKSISVRSVLGFR